MLYVEFVFLKYDYTQVYVYYIKYMYKLNNKL